MKIHYHGVLSSVKSPDKNAARKSLGEVIRVRRNALNLSQEKFAEVVGAHRNYIGKVERGEQNITVDSLLRFAHAFDCAASDLLSEARL